MHYYQFNIGDYKSHTDYLSPIEDLAYRRMMDWCYLHEKPLPLSIDEIARKINLREFTDEIELILVDFFVKTPEGYENQRVSEEILSYKNKAESARNNGKKGGRPRKETQEEPKKTQSVLDENPEETKAKTKQEPRTINQEPLTKKQGGKKISLPDDFSVSEKMKEWFANQGFCTDIKKSTNTWIDAMKAKDFKYVNWESAWRNGMRKHDEWQREKGGANTRPSSPNKNGFDSGFEQ